MRNYYKSLYEQRRFSDASKYVERMLYYFKAKGKVLDALNDVEKVFPEGRMKDCIGNAVRHIQDTVDENAVKDALEIIEQEYSCRRIKRLHAFLLQIENDGGDMDMGVETLLRDPADLDRHKSDVSEAEKKCQNSWHDFNSIIVCNVPDYIVYSNDV